MSSDPGQVLAGRVALVTGGAQAAGRGYSVALARAGAAVVVADCLEESAHETIQLITGNGGEAVYFDLDVTDEQANRRAVQKAVETFGGLDILVNNAATYGATRFAAATDITVEDWDRTMSVFVKGPWLATKAAIAHLSRSEHPVIVNHTSVAAYGVNQWLDYGVARGAVIAMTKSLAHELAPARIRVNAIAAGSSGIEAVALGVIQDDRMMLETADFKRQLIPRLSTLEDLGSAAVFLASESSSYITGQTLVVDGGKFLMG